MDDYFGVTLEYNISASLRNNFLLRVFDQVMLFLRDTVGLTLLSRRDLVDHNLDVLIQKTD